MTTRSSSHPATRGLTLLELVAAMAIFALVAIMGLQAISGSLRARDRLATTDANAAQLSRALTLLRRDLKSAAPLRFLPPDAPDRPEATEAPFIDATRAGGGSAILSLTVAGQPVLPDQPAGGLSRVIWRLDRATGQLTRQVWPVLRPASGAAASAEVPMLQGVRDMTLRAYASAEAGWITDWGRPDIVRATTLPDLPKGVDLRLDSKLYGPLRIVVSSQ